jgi:hypothetical protein
MLNSFQESPIYLGAIATPKVALLGNIIRKDLRGSPEAFRYAGGFERLDERSKLRGVGPTSG